VANSKNFDLIKSILDGNDATYNDLEPLNDLASTAIFIGNATVLGNLLIAH
jgi:hypothetical protein